MIRLTKQADYGIVLMTQLASTGQCAAAELAAQTHLPAPMVSKILKLLAKAGLLVSHRGVHGGYELARSAAEISVAHVIFALEGPIALTECSEHSEHECSYEAFCRVRDNWQRINRAVREALEGITIAEMARPDFMAGAPGRVAESLISLRTSS